MNLSSVIAVGFILGLKHATEADHVTAVATLVTGQRSVTQIARQGIAWGFGHALTLFGIGFVVLTVGQAMPSRLAQSLECAVGVMLVILGADLLRRMYRSDAHGPAQPHSAAPLASSSRSLVVGMMHGMAGSAALIILSLGAMRSAGLALLYILIFGIGSMIGMALVSTAIAFPLRLSAAALGKAHRMLMACIGAFSCVLGAWVIYRIGTGA